MIEMLKKFQVDDGGGWKYELPKGVKDELSNELKEGRNTEDDNIPRPERSKPRGVWGAAPPGMRTYDESEIELTAEDEKNLENIVNESTVEQIWEMLMPGQREEFIQMLETEYEQEGDEYVQKSAI
jgi:hypothetical protein